MRRLILLTAVVLCLSSPAWGDTVLVGSDGSNYGTSCWLFPASTIDNYSWKASRFLAVNTGTISYFRVRVGSTPTGCTNDSGCWAIYEGGTNSTPGALKAYSCFSGYNWTTIGVGWHTFNVTTTVTDLTVTSGQYYWLVFYSYGTDATYYANAGCSAYIPAYRGSSNGACIATAGMDNSSGYASQGEIVNNVSVPPAPEAFNLPLQTYVMWGVWGTALPTITSPTPTTINHGDEITITGGNFGSKSPAAPLWWDNGEGATDGLAVGTSGELTWVTSGTLSGTNKHYNAAEPYSITQDSGAQNIRYRNVNYRTTSAPHSRSTKYITGAHSNQFECADTGPTGSNVALNVSDGSTHPIWYVHFYMRLDPDWPLTTETGAGSHNFKYFNWEADSPYTIYHGASMANYDNTNACSGGSGNLRRGPDCAGPPSYWTGHLVYILSNATCLTGTDLYPVATYNTSVPNPRSEWVREEHLLSSTSDWYKINVNNVSQVDSTQKSGCGLDSGPFGGATIAGFWKINAPWSPADGDCHEALCTGPGTPMRVCTGAGTWSGGAEGKHVLHDDAFRYFDDVYVDNTFSRVMLCNSESYTSATVCEPQPPTAWADGSITVTVNAGAITDGSTAYLFVFDSANSANATGYEVTIGSPGSDTTPPAISGAYPFSNQKCTPHRNPITIGVATNENATCRYSTMDVAYDSMSLTMTGAGTLAHSFSITPQCDANYSYYVRCSDSAGNKNTSSQAINFYVTPQYWRRGHNVEIR